MADMNHLSLRNIPVDIDPNEVLRDYGLDGIAQTSTIVQQGDTMITISNDSPLEPPAISTDSYTDTELNAITDELFGNTDALEAVRSVNEDGYLDENPDENLNEVEVATPTEGEVYEENQGEGRDLDAEENEDWETSLNEGTIAPTETVHVTIGEQSAEIPVITESSSSNEVSENTPNVRTVEEAINLLPVNSKSHELDETTSRFSGAMWYHAIQDSTIVLAGLGGIGGYVLFCLSRMKPRQIFIYDDDIVEETNLSGQLYSMSMIGRYKVDSMSNLARDFSNYYGVQAIPQRFTPTTAAGDIMICGFDNMQARNDFFNAWINHLVGHPHPENCLFLDGRLDMESFQVFCITGDCTFDIKRYSDKYLFDDYQAESVQCSMKQTTYCANMIGSVIVNLFTNFIANQISPCSRDLPFKTYYDASMMYFKTET